MVQGRVAGTGQPFDLGEVTAPRCVIRLPGGAVGHAQVQGRGRAHAKRATMLDALLQTGAARRLRQVPLALEATTEATVIQTRHRIPETPLTEGQIQVYQVPIPEPLRFLEPRETETRKMHGLEEYGPMPVKLYEDIARHGRIATSYDYPVKVEGG